MSFFGSLFGGGQKKAASRMEEAAQRAMQARQEAEQRARQDLNPYIESGRNALGNYEGGLAEMRDQPAFLEKILSGYKPSSAYSRRMQEGLQAIKQAYGAQGGMYGSGDYDKALMEHGQYLADQDQQQYLNNILGIRGDYLDRTSGLVDKGYGASNNLANIAYGTGQGIAGNQMDLGAAQAQKELARGGLLNNILGLGFNTIFGGLGRSGFMNNAPSWAQGAYGGFQRGLGYMQPYNGIYGQGIR